jgi:hypothetical protein
MSLRFRDRMQSVRLPKTGHGYQTGGCRRKVLEISVRHSTGDRNRVYNAVSVAQQLPQRRLRGLSREARVQSVGTDNTTGRTCPCEEGVRRLTKEISDISGGRTRDITLRGFEVPPSTSTAVLLAQQFC